MLTFASLTHFYINTMHLPDHKLESSFIFIQLERCVIASVLNK